MASFRSIPRGQVDVVGVVDELGAAVAMHEDAVDDVEQVCSDLLNDRLVARRLDTRRGLVNGIEERAVLGAQALDRVGEARLPRHDLLEQPSRPLGGFDVVLKCGSQVGDRAAHALLPRGGAPSCRNGQRSLKGQYRLVKLVASGTNRFEWAGHAVTSIMRSMARRAREATGSSTLTS